MARPFTPIEIAEGALLADMAVLAQLVAVYLPIFDILARLGIAIIFAVLVLRRGLYVGILSALVAGFIITALTGLTYAVPLVLTCGAGLFLGITMRLRVPHFPLILLGMTGGGLVFVLLLVLFTLAAGLPLSSFATQLRNSYIGRPGRAGGLVDCPRPPRARPAGAVDAGALVAPVPAGRLARACAGGDADVQHNQPGSAPAGLPGAALPRRARRARDCMGCAPAAAPAPPRAAPFLMDKDALSSGMIAPRSTATIY